MDQPRRDRLRQVVTDCRRELEAAILDRLEAGFAIFRTGRVQEADQLVHLSADEQQFRAELVAHLQHIQSTMLGGGSVGPDAVTQLAREIGFTHLNRLCAFKILEARGLVREPVKRGMRSSGFLFYLGDNPDDEHLLNAGQDDLAYRHYLEWLGRTLGQEIGALFSPSDPANRIFPLRAALLRVLDLINGQDLADIWLEDETIGWVFQYYTPKEQRDAAHKASSAPRSSYELAFLNQFFTPRYVVEFLVENTLGRLWWEMRQGQTALATRCRYLAHRKEPIFLGEKEAPPDADAALPDAQTERVRYRRKKDPRQLRVLDPACGSGHFLLYCFDLLETIYDEAYDDKDLGPTLQREYPDRARYRLAVPGLILRHNLHGIDIDARAIQIVGLALWLRVQRAYQGLGVGRVIGQRARGPAATQDRAIAPERPILTKANLVVAEPMPGEADLLQDFTRDLQPRILGVLAQDVFKQMKLAGEAGALLKIETEIQDAIIEVKQLWKRASEMDQLNLWPEQARPKQLTLFNLADITDEQFWDQAEGRLLEALDAYASRAELANVDEAGDPTGAVTARFARRLFAEDASSGFAFIDLCRGRYDVVLMNPPFGAPSIGSKKYIEQTYPRTKNDLYAAFVERGLGWLRPRGLLGAITSRTGFFLSSFQKWREEIVLGEARPTIVADLGYGVLDTAKVETAAYCLERCEASVRAAQQPAEKASPSPRKRRAPARPSADVTQTRALL